jgi:FAD-dependent urate hydroxylase
MRGDAHAPVVVIGGGIGGLAAALALDRAGIAVEVYERAPELNEVGAGIGLWPNALRALDRIGVGEDIRALAVTDADGGLRSASGRVLVHMPGEDLHQRYGAPTTGILRSELQLLMARRFGVERLHLGHEFVGVEQDGHEVRAHFANGATAAGRVLVGADGLHSAVRQELFADGPPRYRGDTAWRGLAPTPPDLEPMRDLFETFGVGSRFGVFPLHGGRIMWFVSALRPAGERDGPDVLDELRASFADWHAPIPRILEVAEPASILRNDIYDRPFTSRWVVGRVALLGDAAHPMGPDLGQGACQAIEDAETLALALARTGEPERALALYQHVRVARVRMVSRIVAATGWLASRRSAAVCTVRDAVMGATPAFAARRQLDLLAGWDPPERLRTSARTR